ncbi:MAG: hybrid sensor histidine kinase/response regulator [Proteobacteria bacterium]|nr:hybrid sensor histidine kinase/response regulator [Pseudomonadota bacterium]
MNNEIDRKGNILVVDDKPDNLRLLVNLLSKQGYQVRPVPNGKLALSGSQAIPPDLILLDVMMPEMDGFETCRQLKASPKTEDIPIVFLTAKTSTEDIVKGFNLGAVDYVTKPFNQTELLARVKTHLSLKFSQETVVRESRKRKELLQILCHDLQNQISGSLGFWELILEDHSLLSDFKDLINKGLNNALNIIGLVHKMRALDDKKHTLEIRKSNLKTLVKQSYHILEQRFLKKNIDMEMDIDDQTTVMVEETSFVNSVVNNLFTNAIKFSFPGSKIVVDATREHNRVVLSIRDFGIGMSKELVDDVFDENKATNRRGTEDEPGTGYGMPLVKKFIDTYGGEIEVISRQKEEYPDDHGTEIRIGLDDHSSTEKHFQNRS